MKILHVFFFFVCFGVSGVSSCPQQHLASETSPQPRMFLSFESEKSCKAELSRFAPGARYAAWRPSCLSPSTLSRFLLWLTHLYINKPVFSTSVSPEHKQYKRPRLRGEPELTMPKIKTYVTSPPAEGAPPLLSVSALWVVLALPLWGTHQSNNNEGGFG